MPGLLDLVDDPNQLGLLSLGLRLMSTPGKFGAALGQAGMGALGDVQQARSALEARKLREQQMRFQQLQEDRASAAEQRLAALAPIQQEAAVLQLRQAQDAERAAQEQRARDDAFIKAIPSPQGQALQALGADASPTMANAARMPAVDPRNQFLYEALQARQLKPMEYLTATAKDDAPIKLGPDEVLLSGRSSGYKTLAQGLPKASDTPAAIREYQFAVNQGYQGTFQQFDAERRRAGATNVNVPINTAKPLLNTMAEGLGKQIDANLGAARAAVDTIGGAQRIRTLLDSGQVVTGPGADWRIAARQVGSVLGVGGKDNDEVLANTRKTMQQLAQFELDAAQSMKGQGAITESEREILRRAAAGMITFTQPELKALSATLEERARKRIRVHNQDVDRLGQMPDGAQLVPFYRVPEPGTGSAVDDIVNRYRSR